MLANRSANKIMFDLYPYVILRDIVIFSPWMIGFVTLLYRKSNVYISLASIVEVEIVMVE